MRILLIAPHPFYIDRGTPIDVDILLRSLSEQGHRVDAVVYRDGKDRTYEGVRLHRPRMPRWLTGLSPGFSLRKLVADIYLSRLVTRLARRHRYDVVHAGEEAVFIAMWLKRRRGIPYIYDMDSSIAQQMVEKLPVLKPIARLLNWCEARSIRAAAAVAPVSNALRDLAQDRGARRITTLHDISQLKTPDRRPTGHLRQSLHIDGEPIVLYVGNLEKYQGIDLLLESFAIAQRTAATARLVIAGGTARTIGRYRRKADWLGVNDRVHFIGGWPASRLDELLAEADVLTAPRIKGINTPMKVFPYLHSGKPVLLTDLRTHTQLLNRQVAMLAPPDPVGFADAMTKLIEDGALRRTLGDAGRRFVEQNHTYPAHHRRVASLYASIADVIAPSPKFQD